MNYYKIMNVTTIIGIGTSWDLRRTQGTRHLTVACDEEKAQYIQYKEALYHADWMLRPFVGIDCTSADIHMIGKEEYEALAEALQTEEEIIEDQPQEPQEQEQDTVDPTEQATIEYIREQKIAQMRKACNQAIVSGVDVELTSGEIKHFSMEVEDQLNLITLSTMISAGVETVPYHANGELCDYYSAADMLKIIQAATEAKTYHTTYYNCLEKWIASMDTIEEIADVEYGVQVPEAHCSIVMMQLMAGRDGA